MAVTNAFWGRISDKVCPSDDGDPVTDCIGSRDTLPLVKKKCEGKKECKLSARHRWGKDKAWHDIILLHSYIMSISQFFIIRTWWTLSEIFREWKKSPWPAAHPRTLFCLSDPGVANGKTHTSETELMSSPTLKNWDRMITIQPDIRMFNRMIRGWYWVSGRKYLNPDNGCKNFKDCKDFPYKPFHLSSFFQRIAKPRIKPLRRRTKVLGGQLHVWTGIARSDFVWFCGNWPLL